MIVRIDKRFEKDIKAFKNQKINSVVIKLIDSIKKAENISQIKNIKKLLGYKFYYRIREGDYRIGLEVNNEEIILIRFLHRKDIYNKWP